MFKSCQGHGFTPTNVKEFFVCVLVLILMPVALEKLNTKVYALFTHIIKIPPPAPTNSMIVYLNDCYVVLHIVSY